MPATSPEALDRQRKAAARRSFVNYHARQMVLAAKGYEEMKTAIEQAKLKELPRHILIYLYDKHDRYRDKVETHMAALKAKKPRTYVKNEDLIFDPEIEAFLKEVKQPDLGTRADRTFFEDTLESNPELAAMIDEEMNKP